ncbi:MAG: exodeoxyribonuclease V subunit gamma [Opitutales bacterium]
MPIHLIESTLQEELAERLIQSLSEGVESGASLWVDTVVVQNSGLGRWLRLLHARRSGISAAVKMPFAQSFIAKELEQMGRFERRQELTPSVFRWQIFDFLQSGRYETWDDAGPLSAYLSETHTNVERRRWSLAGRLAQLFDRYAVHRPEWILAWVVSEQVAEALPHARWQARIFREIMEAMGLSAGDLNKRLIGLALHQANRDPVFHGVSDAPVHVFGISSFPTAYLKFFSNLSAYREVYLYHLVPSEAYLGELPKNYRASILAEMGGGAEAGEPADLLQNPLLIANGQAAARFQSLLLALDFPVGELPVPPKGGGASDLLELQNALRLNEAFSDFSGDGSLSLHRCHSRIREVQVLQQQLLAMMQADPSLRPEEIMVLVPEIADYTDAIQSVFGMGTVVGGGLEKVRIPFCIADQKSPAEGTCWRFFTSLIRLLKGRQLFSEVIELLDFDPVCQRLGLNRDEIKELSSLLQSVGVRWGIDAESRRSKGLPDYAAYTWDYGLQQIYSGMIYGEGAPSGRAACVISEQTAESIGALTQFLSPIFEFSRRSHERLDFGEWSEAMLAVLRHILGDGDSGGEWMRLLAIAIGDLGSAATDAAIHFETYCAMLEEGNVQVSGPSGLLRHGVTFCRMQPARHIPARVLCILGLDEGAYPRQGTSLEFDLIEQQRRKARGLKNSFFQYKELHYLSDVPLRDEDRQLFLDCLLNARDQLYLSYVGQSVHSNQELPPSVLVSELMHFLGRAREGGAEAGTRRQQLLEQINLRHPLQEWSLENFTRPQPRNGQAPVPLHFNTGYTRIANQSAEPRPFIDEAGTTEATDTEEPQVSAEQILRFLKDPAKDYLKEQLHVSLDLLEWAEMPEDQEAFELDGAANWQLRKQVLDAWLLAKQQGGIPDAFADQLRQRWIDDLTLPIGHAGEAVWSDTALPVLESLQNHLNEPGIRKSGSTAIIDDVSYKTEHWETEDGQRLIFLNGDLKKPKYTIEAFLRHVGSTGGSQLITLTDKSSVVWPSFAAVSEEAEDFGYSWLRSVLALWRHNRIAPVAFSLEIACEFVKKRRERDEEIVLPDPELLRAAYERKWTGFNDAGLDYSVSQCFCFDGDSPASPQAGASLQAAFMENAIRVFDPVLEWSARLRGEAGK